jgi:hypothetical protein
MPRAVLAQEVHMAIPPYGVAIQDAIAAGDLAQMKALRKQAEAILAQQGDVASAFEALKIEIAKLEGKR